MFKLFPPRIIMKNDFINWNHLRMTSRKASTAPINLVKTVFFTIYLEIMAILGASDPTTWGEFTVVLAKEKKMQNKKPPDFEVFDTASFATVWETNKKKKQQFPNL